MSEELDDIKELFRAYLKWIIGFFAVITLFGVIWFIGGRSVQIADNAIIHYEEFQEIYNSAQAFNQKLCNIKGVKADDAMFKDFSQAAQVNGLRNNLTRWIEEYNGKSKMWNRSLWKSNKLPYQLSVSDFNCY